MFRLNYFFSFLALLFFSLSIQAQTEERDSLLKALQQHTTDSLQYKIYLALGDIYQQQNTDSAAYFHQKAREKAEKLKDTFLITQAMNLEAIDYYINTNYDKGKIILENTLYLIKKAKPIKKIKKIQASCLNLLGLIEKDKSNYPVALEHLFEALKINEAIADVRGQANNLGNIGHIFYEKEEITKAKSYYQKALAISEQHHLEATNHIISLGNVEVALLNYTEAENYFFKALTFLENQGNPYSLGVCYNNLAECYEKQKKWDKALSYYQKSMEVTQKIENKYGEMSNLNSIGRIYLEIGNLQTAEILLQRAWNLANEIQDRENQKNIAENLSLLYEKQKKPALALKYLRRHLHLKDSLSKTEHIKSFLKKEFEYNYEKQKLADSLKNAEKIRLKNIEIAKNQAEIRAKTNGQIALFGGLFSAFLLVGVLYNRFRITNKQKKIIQLQKEEVEKQKGIVEIQKAEIEHKNRNIVASIQYAERIQKAMLPVSEWQAIFPRSFVLYIPRDIVAGDFYWLEETEEAVFFAVADCTGHGVPGAMVSMLCSSVLTKIVLEEKIYETNLILDRAKQVITENFTRHSQYEIKDGMDICLCKFDKNTKKSIEFSGAKRPLWILRDNEILEFEGDKMPISQFSFLQDKSFTKNIIDLQENDRIILFTDGYADQFGGENNKKLGSRNLKKYLSESFSLNIEEQGKLLEEKMKNWKSNNEQTDDITLIGIEVKA